VVRRVLYFIIMLTLVLCMMLPITTPVVASDIEVTKNTIPLLPNKYYVGDTIHYEMTVSNPNTSANYLDRIWDTLPDGTVIEFLYEGSPYGNANNGTQLVQNPGESDTFYADYTVDADDMVWLSGPGYWVVINEFEAEGENAEGAAVYGYTGAISQIMVPDIDIEKYVWDGAVWQDADTTTGPYLPSTQDPVVFKFEIDNTGDVELTNVNLNDTDMTVFYTNQNCTTPAVFPISILYDDDPIVTVYGKLDWAQGQHSNTATATGTPPVGAPVSDSDSAHYFGSSASIDVEKYVWDGVGWQDADTTTGPYLPSTQNPVVFRFVITNNDNVNLTNVTLTDTDISSFYTNQACTINASFPTTLAIGQAKTYYGKLDWAQGQHSNTATATGTPPVGAPVSDSDSAHYFGSSPSIDVEKAVWDGATWHDADTTTGPYLPSTQNPVVFRFVITNNDNVNLTNVTLTDTDMLVFYTDQTWMTTVTFPITLVTSASMTVYGKLDWAQGQHSNTATATGTPPAGAPVSDSDPAHYFGSGPDIDIEKHTNGVDADTAPGPNIEIGNTVTWAYIVKNTGSVNLTNVVVTDDKLGIVGTIPSLPVDAEVTLYAYGTAAAGQYSNVGAVTGEPPVGADVSDSDPSHYYGRTTPPPPTVGWETYPVNKVRVLLPWIALLTAIIVGASLLTLRRRRAQS